MAIALNFTSPKKQNAFRNIKINLEHVLTRIEEQAYISGVSRKKTYISNLELSIHKV
jgi:hypothetical protein